MQGNSEKTEDEEHFCKILGKILKILDLRSCVKIWKNQVKFYESIVVIDSHIKKGSVQNSSILMRASEILVLHSSFKFEVRQILCITFLVVTFDYI